MPGHPTITAALVRLTSIALLSGLAVACGSAAQSVPSQGSSPSPITASLVPGPSTVAASASTPGGPTAYAAWIERQGFGGSSGLNNVVKLIHFVADRPGDETTFDIDDQSRDIEGLVAWLDAHPATKCWTDYHAAVRASLTKVLAAYATGRTAVAAGTTFPAEVAKTMVAEADQVLAVAGPTDCP